MGDILVSLALLRKVRERDEKIAEQAERISALERQVETARNLACRRLLAYGERGMVTIVPDFDG